MTDRRHYRSNRGEPGVQRFLMGVGLDSDGHARITRSAEFLLMGGSAETHDVMRETVEAFTETLRRMGTDLNNASEDEMLEAADEAGMLSDGEEDEY